MQARRWNTDCMQAVCRCMRHRHDRGNSTIVPEVGTMWTKPDFTEMRFGFEITMYIGNR